MVMLCTKYDGLYYIPMTHYSNVNVYFIDSSVAKLFAIKKTDKMNLDQLG